MMWIRLDVVRLFIEHTCPPGQTTLSVDAQNAFMLWKVNPLSISKQREENLENLPFML